MVIRSWLCQNKRCGVEFDATTNHPACTKCGCVRTQWVPKPVAVRGSSSTSQIDRVVRGLADDYNMTNLPKTVRGQPTIGNRQVSAPPMATLNGRQIPLDRVSTFKTGAKVGGSLGATVGGNTAPLKSMTSIVAKADR